MAIKNTERFASIVRDKVAQLGLTQTDIHNRGGPSDTTLRRIMAGDDVGVSLRTLSRLDTVFRWEPGSAARALAGGDPTPAAQAIAGAGVSESFKIAITPTVGMEATDPGATTPLTPYDRHLKNAELLLQRSRESVQVGDFLSAIHALEALQSITELLIDHISSQAVQGDGPPVSSDDSEPWRDTRVDDWRRRNNPGDIEDGDQGSEEIS